MDIPWIRIVSQSGVYATFACYLLWAVRRGPKEWAPLLGASLYAVLFEHWNMLRYAQSQGGYHYHAASWLWIWGDVPLYIPLAWGFILATSRSLTDQLGLRPWARPFADALLALLIDVSMDAVAIRLKFWYWHGVGWNEAFFGVPADNFVGWLLVSFTFSALTRWLWRPPVLPAHQNGTQQALIRKVAAQMLLIPPAAYGAYLGIEALVHVQYALFHAETLSRQLYVLAGTIAVFTLMAVIGVQPRAQPAHPPRPAERRSLTHIGLLHGPRHIFHLFGLLGLLCVPVAARIPALWLLAGGVWFMEWSIALYAAKRAHPTLRGSDLVYPPDCKDNP